MLHFLRKDNVEEVKYPTQPMIIQDGNALFHSFIGLAPTFGVVSLKMLSQMAQKQNFIFSTDHTMRISSKARKENEEELEINLYLIVRPSEYQMILNCFCQMIEIRNGFATC